MPGALSSLFVEFSAATDKFNAAMADAVRSAKEVDKALKPIVISANAVGDALAAGVTVPILALGTAAVSSAVKIDDALAGIRAQTGKTGEAFQQLGTDFRTVLADVPNSIADVGRAIGELTSRTNLVGAPLEALATQELNLARITKTDIGETIAASTRVFGDWNIATDKQSGALDFLYKVGQQTGIGFSQLSRSVQQFGVPLREMGFSFEQSAALIGNFEKAGVNTDNVMAALRKSLATLGKAGVTDVAAGLDILIDRIKNAGTVSQANAVAVAAFGAKAGPTLAAAVRDGKFAIDALVDSVNKSPDSINAAAKASETFANKLDELEHKAALALEPLGKTMLEALERLLPLIQNAIGIVADLTDRFSRLPASVQNGILIVGAFAAAVGPAILVVASLARQIILLTTLAGAAGISVAGFGDAIAALQLFTAVRTVGQFSEAISLLGATSVAATAGLVAIAGAIGFGVGLVANYIIKITGLQGALDGLVKRTVELVPVLGNWLTAQNSLNAANNNVTESSKTLTAELAKHGIVVDQTRLNDSAYIASLAQQREAQIAASGATNAHSTGLKNLSGAAKASAADLDKINALLSGNASAAKQFENAVKNLVDSVTEETKKGPELVAALKILNASHTDMSLIVEKLGKNVLTYSDALLKEGLALPPIVAKVREATLAQEEANNAASRAFEIAVKIGEITEKNAAALKEEMIVNATGKADMVRIDTEYAKNLTETSAALAEFLKTTYKDELTEKIKATNDAIANDVSYAQKIRDLTDATRQYKQDSEDAYARYKINLDTYVLMQNGAFTADELAQQKTLVDESLQAWRAYNAEYLKLDQETTNTATKEWDKFFVSQEQAQENMKLSMAKAMSGITTNIASELSNDIVHWSGWASSALKIVQDLASKMLDAFLTGLLNPLTNVLSGIGKSISGALSGVIGGGGGGILGGVIGGGGGAAAGAIGAEAAGIGGGAAAAGAIGAEAAGVGGGAAAAGATGAAAGSGGLLSSMGALATNPITIAAAAAVGVGLLINHFVGQGRKTANQFVQTVQNPFGSQLSQLVDAFNASNASGTLTLDQAKTAQSSITQLISAFNSTSSQFASQGSTQAKVVSQAQATMVTDFGPAFSKILDPINATITKLSAAATTASTVTTAASTSTTINATDTGVFATAIKSFADWVARLTGSTIPQTGLATSASAIFADTVTRFEAAVAKVVPGGAGTTITVDMPVTVSPTFDFSGTEIDAATVRDTIMPEITDALSTGIRGFKEKWTLLLQNQIVSTQVATS